LFGFVGKACPLERVRQIRETAVQSRKGTLIIGNFGISIKFYSRGDEEGRFRREDGAPFGYGWDPRSQGASGMTAALAGR
jgi:hypothetical protein